MHQFLYQYDLNPTTWVYLSSLLIVAIFFKFSRLLSIRNFDLLGLLAIAPGVLMLAYRGNVAEENVPEENVSEETAVQNDATTGDGTTSDPATNGVAEDAGQDGATQDTGERPGAGAALADANSTDGGNSQPNTSDSGPNPETVRRWGFIVLFSVGFLFLIRLLVDTMLVRRPLLEPNLSPGGLAFLATAMFVFLMTNVLTAKIPASAGSASTVGQQKDESETAGQETALAMAEIGQAQHRQAYENHPILRHLPSVPSRAFDNKTLFATGDWTFASRILILLAHLTVVIGLLLIGLRHFGNLGTGVAMSSLYLLLPYKAQLIGRVEHVLPPAFFVAAVVSYRRPAVAGFFLTSSLAVMLAPLALLMFPLWISFYRQRGLWRFASGLASGLLFLAICVLILEGASGFGSGMLALFGGGVFGLENATGFWTASGWYLRVPVGAFVLVISLAMAIWPAQKNLGTLMACSAAILLSAQFWFPFEGMMYVHWYLPLALLTVFRPNLENRVAIASLGQAWWIRKQEATPQAA
mgnify:CR=1 FL=1